jgi:hypothetical protein
MESIRGSMVGRQPEGAEEERRCWDGERRLIAAIILRAVEQVEAGGAQAAEARDWLITVGCAWAERFLKIEGIDPTDWQRISLKAARKIVAENYIEPPRAWDPERGRRYRERLRSLGVQRIGDLPQDQRPAPPRPNRRLDASIVPGSMAGS